MEKSQKFETTTASYVIAAHGTMLTSLNAQQTKKYYAINIPINVELYTFADLGNCLPMYKREADFICKNYKKTPQKSHSPAFKFSYEHGKINKFPELFLTPDEVTPAQFYSGVTHCIPEHYRTSGSRKKELIYNIDAKNTKNCNCASIVPNNISSAYDCEKNYSDYYKAQLKDYKYDPDAPASNINKCGPILLSEAVKIIQAHCSIYYGSACVIKIYIFTCLAETDLTTLVDNIDSIVIEYEEEKKGDYTPTPNSETNLMEYYDEVSKHNTRSKVNNNVVENLTDFNAIPLIDQFRSKYRFMIEHKIFDFITYKDTYKEFTSDLRSGVSGTSKQLVEKLEKQYNSLDINKLGICLIEALNKIKFDESDNDPTILPNMNEIDIAHPFIANLAKVNEPAFINVIYERLKILINKAQEQKLASGRRRRKKTLRQRKFPYVKKKSTKKKLTKKA